eukprot:TRINITY_DN48132_c0_g1_i4.p1 TRINITY_DN48132_c0_g1~~TRINITY_DN48132_c0_g1_i4.p1  ORF type:complete len:216 (-),score=13.85 TRINITY_DN48132_c0_g1_i4:81-728(-)
MGQSLIRPRSGYMRPDDVDLEEQAATAVDGPSETSEAGDAPPEAPPTNTYFGTEFRAEGGRTLPTVDATRAELGLGEAGVDSLFQPPKIHVTKAISCSVNLNDKTITIRRVATNPSQFILEFEFDADEAGSINLYFGVIEKLDASNNPTSVLPCRHLCLCAECAEVLRYKANKCPICRAPVRALLKLNDGKPATTTEVTEEKTPSTETSLLTEEE